MTYFEQFDKLAKDLRRADGLMNPFLEVMEFCGIQEDNAVMTKMLY